MFLTVPPCHPFTGAHFQVFPNEMQKFNFTLLKIFWSERSDFLCHLLHGIFSLCRNGLSFSASLD